MTPNLFTSFVEIEFDAPRGCPTKFPPLRREFRSKRGQQASDGPVVVADMCGERLAVNYSTGEVYVFTPTHQVYEPEAMDEIARHGTPEGHACEELGNVDVATILAWMRRCVQAKLARVSAGHFPEDAKAKGFELPGTETEQPAMVRLIEELEVTNEFLAELLGKGP